MEIIPAIDIIGGKCVRLIKGNFKTKKVYSANPLKIAQSFQKAGLKKLHLIDLEGAKEGKIKNWETIEKIAKNTNLKIEFGGGVEDERDIKKLLSFGINKIILGSLVLREPEKFKKIIKKFRDKIIVAVDILGKKICYRGWQEEAKKELSSFLEDLIKLGVKTIICTDIERDGTLRGPNFSLYKKLVSEFPDLEIIASGGIRNKEDLKKLSKIGLSGAIIGKAIYENKISLDDLKSFV
jgi:phosphoribosylformimino-5-aminoimidazole carboxamide ribotide isomerase